MEARIPTPVYSMSWRDVNVAADISEFLTELAYTDNMHGEADELSITLEDSQGFFSGAKADFYPKLGDDLSLAIGYDSGPLEGYWSAGSFVVDEIKVQGPPDQVTMRALSVSGKNPLRQRGSKTWTKSKLREIAKSAAAGAGTTIAGTLPDITLARCTRNNETILEFLTRLGDEWGFIVKGGEGGIVAHSLGDILSQGAYATIRREDVADYDIVQKITNTPRDAVVRYWDINKKDKIMHTVKDRAPVPVGKVPLPNSRAQQAGGSQTGAPSAADVAVILDRVENEAQAEQRRAVRRLRGGMQSAEATVRLMGDPRLRAAMNIMLEGFGAVSRPYVIVRAKHHFSRGVGYETTLDLMASKR